MQTEVKRWINEIKNMLLYMKRGKCRETQLHSSLLQGCSFIMTMISLLIEAAGWMKKYTRAVTAQIQKKNASKLHEPLFILEQINDLKHVAEENQEPLRLRSWGKVSQWPDLSQTPLTDDYTGGSVWLPLNPKASVSHRFEIRMLLINWN